jgi:hypothetical protein
VSRQAAGWASGRTRKTGRCAARAGPALAKARVLAGQGARAQRVVRGLNGHQVLRVAAGLRLQPLDVVPQAHRGGGAAWRCGGAAARRGPGSPPVVITPSYTAKAWEKKLCIIANRRRPSCCSASPASPPPPAPGHAAAPVARLMSTRRRASIAAARRSKSLKIVSATSACGRKGGSRRSAVRAALRGLPARSLLCPKPRAWRSCSPRGRRPARSAQRHPLF